MALDWLKLWVQGYGEARGLSVQAMDEAPGLLLEAGGAWIALEWEADAQALHLYGHPGHASRYRPMPGSAQEAPDDVDDEDDEQASEVETYPASLDLSASDAERRTLHLDPDTGLATLSLVLPFAALSVSAFEAAIDGFIADMALWSSVFAGGAPVSTAPSRDPEPEGVGRMPWGAIAG